MAVRRKPRIKFFLILAVTFVLIAVLLIILLSSPPTAVVEGNSAEFDAAFDLMIVRDEVVYEAKNYGKTKYIAVEGQIVAVGDPIAEVYELGYNDEQLSKLLDLQKTILKYQTEVIRAGVIDATLDDINARIDAKASEIEQAIYNDVPSSQLTLERDMEALLDERLVYLKQVTNPDEQLRDYYTQESDLLTLFATWRSQLTANEGGVVSFYFDGCEPLMTKQNIGSFTWNALKEVAEGKTVETPEKDQGSAPLYRVVNPNEWYVVLMSQKKIPEMHLGNSFSIIFEDYLETQYTGTVYNVSELEQKEGFVYTILIQDNIGPMLGERRVTARLYGVQEGLSVPKSCVKTVENVDYVETTAGEYVPVLVIADKGDTVLIQTYEGSPTLEIGQTIKK